MSKLRPYLLSHKNQLGIENRVLLIGNARQPHGEKVDRVDLLKCFGPKSSGKCIYMPCPNYDTRLMIWRMLLEQTGISKDQLNINPEFSLSTLAFMTEGYSFGDIQKVVEVSLPERRVLRLRDTNKMLATGDFVHSLSKLTPLYRDEFENLTKFTQDVTGETEWRKKKEEALKAAEEEAADKKGGKKGAKKKKK